MVINLIIGNDQEEVLMSCVTFYMDSLALTSVANVTLLLSILKIIAHTRFGFLRSITFFLLDSIKSQRLGKYLTSQGLIYVIIKIASFKKLDFNRDIIFCFI